MSIDAVLQELIAMMHSAGLPISKEDLAAIYLIEVENPDPIKVYEQFKRFSYKTFNCSHFSSDESTCIEWEDECILFECGIPRFSLENNMYDFGKTSTFEFGFRRAFFIKLEDEDGEMTYSDIITCTLEYTFSHELEAAETTQYAFPPYDKPSGLDEFFAYIETLDIYPLVMNRYRPKRLVIYQSD
jgi:hypothetical protein